ncbi:hypothetical protein J0A68_18255 [Algoriphagus sp. H41]|uniref:UDP-glycosyltransferase n=1 Tax=Algoriphagus oliviformis TaxID=2811231 RepID=A0ABS3C9R1_9BACT|nr:hypothetical protein [Algoriphagus oliviformis]MBN7812905.1 hypothetical protein [Algoriphagus oliviformis]
MSTKKVLILIPDGVGLRNFAFSNFVKRAEEAGLEIVYWNNSSFGLADIGLTEVKTPKPRPHFLTDIVKRVKIENYIDWYAEEFEDQAFHDYKFNAGKPSSAKDRVKAAFFSFFKMYLAGDRRKQSQPLINVLERRTAYFRDCVAQLQQLKPDYVFCSNQRPITAVAPIEAAKSLGIPTGTFIFSWDNLPKATMVIDPDHYFVWSDYMKKELTKYNPEIAPERITVTGTPQFEIYRDEALLANKEQFSERHQLKPGVRYICFSGDDHTTSPYDEYYLRDLAESVREINEEAGVERFGILFRRCPVDKSRRYDPVLDEFSDLIRAADPKWEAAGEVWNQIMPMPADQEMLVNTVYHTDIVFNVGSSMVFDFYALGKPCCYFNYDPAEAGGGRWSVKTLNNFIHFRSRPSEDAVFWINDKKEIKARILEYFAQPSSWNEQATKAWYELVIHQPIDRASRNICSKIRELA